MYSVYVLESQSTHRFYIGSTEHAQLLYIGSTEHAQLRVAEHNRGQTKSTRNRGPWKMVYSEEYPTRAEAQRRERQLKNWKSHRSIAELISGKQS